MKTTASINTDIQEGFIYKLWEAEGKVAQEAAEKILSNKQAKNMAMHMLNNEDAYVRCIKEYHWAMIDRGYALRRIEIKKKDTVDFTTMSEEKIREDEDIVFPDAFNDRDYQKWLEDEIRVGGAHALCTLIPPFSECVYRLGKSRYLHIIIKDITLTDNDSHVVMNVTEYGTYDKIWQMRAKGNITLSIDANTDTYNISCGEDFKNDSDILRVIPCEEMNWSTDQKEAWEKLTLAHVDKTAEMLAERHTSTGMRIGWVILSYTALLNYMLQTNKPKTERAKKQTGQSAPASVPQTADTNEVSSKNDVPRVRTIGMLKITSRKMPKAATTDTVRRYKVASWTVKGGIRHMKDGRLIPFKESIHRRKALIGTELDTEPVKRQSVIRLTDNRTDDKM